MQIRQPFRSLACLSAALILLSSAKAFAGPKIACDKPTFDFGTKDSGETVTATFTLTNTGDQPLQIGNITANWSNAGTPAPSISTKTIPPGETATLTAPLLITGSGKFTRTIQVASNDPAKASLALTLSGTAHLPITLEPASLDFGTINVADAQPKTISLRPTDPAKKFVIRTIAAPNYFDTRIDPQPDGIGYTLVFTLKNDVLPAALSGTINVLTNDTVITNIPIPYAARLQSDIVAKGQGNGATISILRGADGVGHSADFALAPAQAGTKFAVTSNALDGIDGIAGVAATVTTGEASEWLIKLANIPKTVDLQGKFLTITTDLPRMKQIRIGISDPGGRTAALEWGPALDGLQMALQPPAQTYTPAQNFAIPVLIRNVTDKTIKIPATNAADFLFEGTKPNGTPIDLTPAGQTRVATTRPMTVNVDLPAGGQRQIGVNPKTYVDLSKDGTYILKAIFNVPKKDGTGTAALTSNEAKIQIKTPPPPLPEGLP